MHGADADTDAPLGQSRLNLGQGDVPLLGEQPFDEVGLRFDLARMAVTAARLGDRPAMLKR